MKRSGQSLLKLPSSLRQQLADAQGLNIMESKNGLPHPIQRSLFQKGIQVRNSSAGVQFEAFEHEREKGIPTFEREIAQQGFQILKKGSACSQSLANGAVLFVHEV